MSDRLIDNSVNCVLPIKLSDVTEITIEKPLSVSLNIYYIGGIAFSAETYIFSCFLTNLPNRALIHKKTNRPRN